MSRLYRLGVQSAHEKSLLLLGLISDKFAQRMHASAKLAERVGFEPTIRKAGFWPLQRLFAQK
jgi:hypothetical protein